MTTINSNLNNSTVPVQQTSKQLHKSQLSPTSEVISEQADEIETTSFIQGQALTQIELDTQMPPEIDVYLSQLKPYLSESRLSIKEKKQVFHILRTAKKDGFLPILAEELDKQGTLTSLYSKMKLPHKPNKGFSIPVHLNNGSRYVLTQNNFPNYTSDSEFEDRSVQMKRILQKGSVSPEILSKLN